MLGFVCGLVAWGLMGSLLWTIGRGISRTLSHARHLHRIPCSHCAFFTGDYNLKCTLHPYHALSEAAIGCRDYEAH